MARFKPLGEDDDKAGYNQAGRITEVLGNLRITYLSSMIGDDNSIDLSTALKTIRRILAVIAGKVKKEDIDEMNKQIYTLHIKIGIANMYFIHDGRRILKNPRVKEECEILIENLYRKLEKMQDTYGYGMISQEDPRLAVLQR